MSNHTSSRSASQSSTLKTSKPASEQSVAPRHGLLRRTVAGVLAAGAIAFGGIGTLSVAEASAAGVQQHAYVMAPAVLPSTVTVAAPSRSDD